MHSSFIFGSWHKFINNATSDSPQYHSGWLTQTIAGETRAGVSTQNNGNYSETFGNSDWFGPELGFVKRANEINLTSNPIAILKYTVDGSALIADPATTYQVSDWDTVKIGFSDGDCWKGFRSALTAAVEKPPCRYNPNFKGMIWWQGENGTNATDLKVFIAAVRNHLGTNFGVQNSSEFPVIITGNDFWGAGLKTNVADLDDNVGFIDSVTYGQIGGYTNTHIGSGGKMANHWMSMAMALMICLTLAKPTLMKWHYSLTMKMLKTRWIILQQKPTLVFQ